MPKKADIALPRWGRPSNNVKIGLVGLPNVGKSSTFNILSNLQVPAENFPFCTIEPSKAVVSVPDKRHDKLCAHWKPKSEVPAVLAVTDIAGLVKGASEGKGLGNEFLSNIQQVDAIYHVCRAFTDKDIEHVEGDVDPTRDFEIITQELVAKDIQNLKQKLDKLSKETRSKSTKEQDAELVTLRKAIASLETGMETRKGSIDGPWTALEILVLNQYGLLTTKPVVYLVNISKKNFEKLQNKWFKAIKTWLKTNSPTDKLIPFSVPFEQDLAAMEPTERKAYCEEHKTQSMIPKIINAGYKALGLVNFFTCGADEVRAWCVRENSFAPQAAGVIHTDFEKKFVQAQVYNYADFEELGDEKECKSKGRIRSQGKTYIVKDGDICFFNVGK